CARVPVTGGFYSGTNRYYFEYW
nr:immunoglobulin heavy chain junction region [Macaca mulatta]MOV56381.1 immunoglobulin heavy chain junction region [Macaca mulatta]MOV57228.1 immunoglobulin heavy chain junction region [Macaca mulatta]MOV60192.1 immunoglobulin heavy chain junction region [Macaca mulatta]